jgi:hypothetical protein
MSQRQRKTKNEVINIDCESDNNELGTTGSKTEDESSLSTHTIYVKSESEDESNDATCCKLKCDSADEKKVKSYVNEKLFVNVSNCNIDSILFIYFTSFFNKYNVNIMLILY